jgi:hypothetical protein
MRGQSNFTTINRVPLKLPERILPARVSWVRYRMGNRHIPNWNSARRGCSIKHRDLGRSAARMPRRNGMGRSSSIERQSDVLLRKRCLRGFRAAEMIEFVLIAACVEALLIGKHVQQLRQPP